jgi:NAD(P)-dependent dehydrogenase (short-subunit alcohol dehydrogenase family)
MVLDRVVMNAGVVPKEARKTKQGFEEMFAVNYLANFLLTTELLRRGVIPNNSFTRKAGVTETSVEAGTGAGPERKTVPRIVFVSSETHRTAGKIDFESFAAFTPYTMKESVTLYGYTKLLLETFVIELTRRLSGGTGDIAHNLPSAGGAEVAVHSLCPGPVNTNIAREAPQILHPPMKLFFSIFFKNPAQACKPVVYLSCADAIEGKTGIYLHLMTPKNAGEEALDPDNGAVLWRKTEELIESE